MTHPVVSHEAWREARVALLAKEKEFTRQRDELSRQRRELPWEQVTKTYSFDTPSGPRSMSDLFEGRSQLIVYHFMLAPGWAEGCTGCSFVADHLDGAMPHLWARDISLKVVSRAPLAEIEVFKKRMGWQFNWVSSAGSDFNYDYQVSFDPQNEAAEYNFKKGKSHGDEAPGLSVFKKVDNDIFRTYSTYARGLDILLGAYNFIDMTPDGRNEGDKEQPMKWVRHHDKYDTAAASCCHGEAVH